MNYRNHFFSATKQCDSEHFMMTSSNGNIFRVTDHLCGQFTGPGEFPAQRPVTRSFDVFFDLRLNKRLSKQSWGWWTEKLSRPLWRHCNVLRQWQQCPPMTCIINGVSSNLLCVKCFSLPKSVLFLSFKSNAVLLYHIKSVLLNYFGSNESWGMICYAGRQCANNTCYRPD